MLLFLRGDSHTINMVHTAWMFIGWLGSDYVPSDVQPDVMENREQKMTVRPPVAIVQR